MLGEFQTEHKMITDVLPYQIYQLLSTLIIR